MRSPSVLIRLLLCVLLTINGISGSTAAVRMAVEHAGHAPPASAQSRIATDDGGSQPCHSDIDPASGLATVLQHDAMDHDASPEAPATSNHAEQCCNSSSCQCACAHHFAAAAVDSTVLATLVPAADLSHALDLGHRAPALPHLIRPPIS